MVAAALGGALHGDVTFGLQDHAAVGGHLPAVDADVVSGAEHHRVALQQADVGHVLRAEVHEPAPGNGAAVVQVAA